MTPLERLRYHVSGAIERGEATAIVEVSVDAYCTFCEAAPCECCFECETEECSETWSESTSTSEAGTDEANVG